MWANEKAYFHTRKIKLRSFINKKVQKFLTISVRFTTDSFLIGIHNQIMFVFISRLIKQEYCV